MLLGIPHFKKPPYYGMFPPWKGERSSRSREFSSDASSLPAMEMASFHPANQAEAFSTWECASGETGYP